MNPELIRNLGEVFGLALIVFTTWLSSRLRKKIDETHAEVKTNHGKPAREYIEMIEEVRDGQTEIRDTQKAQHVATVAVETQVAMLGERVGEVGRKADRANRLASEVLKLHAEQAS